MSNPKPSKFEIVKAFAAFFLVVITYVMVSQVVLNLFWRLVLKLIDKAFDKK